VTDRQVATRAVSHHCLPVTGKYKIAMAVIQDGDGQITEIEASKYQSTNKWVTSR